MCAAITRWVQYPIDSVGIADDGRGAGCVGTKGSSTALSSVGDSFTIGSNNDRLHLNIDGDTAPYIVLTSGVDLDPRFLAKDVTEKMHDLGKNDARWDNAICEWTNTPNQGNCFKISSGSLGTSSSVSVVSGTDSAHSTLGFSTKSEVGGGDGINNFSGTVSISGTYGGFLDEVYTIFITNDNDASRGIGTPTKNITYAGTMSTGGIYTYTTDTIYTLTIDVTNGTTMGGGIGNVPRMTWTSSPSSDDSTVATELLYPNTWYNVGTKGLMVKFTDAVFSAGNWTIPCYKADYTSGTNVTDSPGNAYFAYSSSRGDMGDAAVTPVSGTFGPLGSRGIYFKFNPTSGADMLGVRDTFSVTCSAPKPNAYDVNNLNYGNVTVSTESDVKCVIFEVLSGAVQLSTVKFGLQSDGSFSHHDAGNADTDFRFGTVGPGNLGGTSPENGIEWHQNVVPSDISSNTPPPYLYSTKANLSVVATADDSESIGNVNLMGDPIWMNIKLGSSETGANSQILHRVYFDYS